MRLRTVVEVLLIGGLALGALAQAVPYGREHTNPPVASEPTWDRPSTRALAERACFDCHSNRTRWPWYAGIAPASWLVQYDVDSGREELNFSEWDRVYDEAAESAEAVREGEMPPAIYLMLHPESRLTAEERRELAAGLEATIGPGTNTSAR